jgi:hypothetical protein
VGGSLIIAARENDEIPGWSGVVYAPTATGSPFNVPPGGFNNAGQLLFNTALAGRGIDASNDYAVLVRNADGSITKVIQEGDSLPGFGGETFRFFNNTNYAMNNNAFIAGGASLTGDTTLDEVLLVGPATGPLEMILREGDPVPGLTDVFFGSFISSASMLINDSDQLVFRTNLTGDGTTVDDNTAYFLWDATNGIQMILRKGDTTLLGGTAITNVSANANARNGEGGSMAFTNSGWLALNLTYSGGSALARVNVNGAPEVCVGDLTGDNAVGGDDLAILLGAWGPNPGSPADLTGDGVVGGDDLAILLGAWGSC